MPTISLYIRDADYPAWQAIDNKSEWLSDKLNGANPKVRIKVPDGFKVVSDSPNTKVEEVIDPNDPTSQGTPRTGLESLSDTQFQGPLFRNKKKGKI